MQPRPQWKTWAQLKAFVISVDHAKYEASLFYRKLSKSRTFYFSGQNCDKRSTSQNGQNRMRDCSMLITLQSLLKLMILLRFKSFHDIPKSGCFSRQGINSISITPIFPLLHVMKGCYHLILLLKDCCNTKSYCPTEISISYPWLIVVHFRSSN